MENTLKVIKAIYTKFSVKQRVPVSYYLLLTRNTDRHKSNSDFDHCNLLTHLELTLCSGSSAATAQSSTSSASFGFREKMYCISHCDSSLQGLAPALASRPSTPLFPPSSSSLQIEPRQPHDSKRQKNPSAGYCLQSDQERCSRTRATAAAFRCVSSSSLGFKLKWV